MSATMASTRKSPVMQASARLNAIIFASILAVFSAAGLAILALVAPGHRHAHLAVVLLGVFIPGYEPGWTGAVAGFFAGCVGSALLGGAAYLLYARSVDPGREELVATVAQQDDLPEATLLLHGGALGLAIGLVGALGLLATTNWLVLRGTAASSVHARLLGELLPGYRVSPVGSLIGAAELFVILFVAGLAFSALYNAIATARYRRRLERPA